MGNSGYSLLYLGGVALAAAAQVLLKLSARRPHRNLLREYWNALVVGGYGLMVLSSLVTVVAYRGIPLSLAPLLSASSFLLVGAAGVLVFHERPSPRRLCGYGLILLGVCLAGAML